MEPPSPSPSPAPASDPPADAPRVGKFRCARLLGAGGMGEVWKAWDDELRRWVALKFLKSTDAEELARFRREAQVAARLSHPHIAAVYEVGDDAQRPYIAMQHVRGRNLRGFPRHDRRAIVRLIRDAALAVDYAHQAGIVHRDLKPENLMVAGDHVFVMDFGLARASRENSSLTRSGAVLGTPAYMSPEQARGDTKRVDARTDVYGLGATLYDVLAGQPPFAGQAVVDVLVQVATEEARPLRAVDAAIEPDLETIVMRCLEKDPERRYASARELADDLTRWLDGEPILASAPSLVSRLRRRLARRKQLVAAVAAGLAALAVLVPLVLRERAAKDRAERALRLWTEIAAHYNESRSLSRGGETRRARARADEAIAACRAVIARDDFAHAHYFLGRLLVLRGRPDEAERAFERALELDPGLGEARHELGKLRVGRYLAAVVQRRSRPHHQILYGADTPPTVEEIERERPALAELRRLAAADLAVDVGRSSYFSEADALYGRALLDQALGNHDAARARYAQLLDRSPLWASAHGQLASMDYLDGRYDDALKHANDALRVDAGYAPACRMRVLVALAANRPPSLDDIERYLRDEERPAADDLMLRGIVHRKRGDMEAALADFARGLDLEPDNVLLLVNRAQVRGLAGDLDGALADAERAIRVTPDGLALLARAEIHERRRDLRAALADLDAAAARLPRLPDIFLTRARLRQETGDFAGAIRDGDHVIALQPEHAAAHINRGNAKMSAGDLPGAIRDLERATSLDANDALGWSNLGLARHMAGDPDGARAAFDRAVDLAPSNAAVRASRAIGRFKNGDIEGASQDLEKAVELGSRTAETHHVRGLIRQRRGDLAGAIESYGAALAIDPRHANALAQRGVCRQLGGDFEAARRDYDAALAIDAKQPEALANRGGLRLMDGDVDGALADFDAAVVLRPSPDLLFNRAQARFRRGDRRGSRADLEEALRTAPASWPHRGACQECLRQLGE